MHPVFHVKMVDSIVIEESIVESGILSLLAQKFPYTLSLLKMTPDYIYVTRPSTRRV